MIHKIIDSVLGVQLHFADDLEWTFPLEGKWRSIKPLFSIHMLRNKEDANDIEILNIIVGPILFSLSWDKNDS